MKKPCRAACSAVNVLILVCLALAACKEAAASASKDGKSARSDWTMPLADEEGVIYADEAAVLRAFTLDFRPETPEPPETETPVPETPVPGTSEAVGTGQTLVPSGEGGSSSDNIIPGLRKLDAYKTAYIPAPPVPAAPPGAEQAAPGALSSGGSGFAVADWGPKGFLSSAVQRPSVYVVFSEPVVPLTAPSGSGSGGIVILSL